MTDFIASIDPQIPDHVLLARVAADDTSALGTLYDRHRAAAFGLALRITNDAGLAEDVVQEAFLGVWRNAGRFDTTRGAVRTWLMAIVHHRAIDVIRGRRPTSELPEDSALPGALVKQGIWPEVAARLDRDSIARALQTLGPSQREAIEMAYFSGLTQMEIARETGTPLGTVKSRVRLGLLALRAVIERDGYAVGGAT